MSETDLNKLCRRKGNSMSNTPVYGVNVSKIKHRSVFRYPGGKTWLVPTVKLWLENYKTVHGTSPELYVEPFVGGGSCALEVAASNLARHTVIGDLDEEIIKVWNTIFDENLNEKLANKIENFEFTTQTVYTTLNSKPRSQVNCAFQTILRNRVTHGGVLAKGAGLMKLGENKKGASSRWYPETLATRIRETNSYRDCVTVLHKDAFGLLETYKNNKHAVFLLDPPYTAGKRLYTHNTIDNSKLFESVEQLVGEFLLTFDNTVEILALAEKYGFEYTTSRMRNTKNQVMTELLVSKDLSWLRTQGTS